LLWAANLEDGKVGYAVWDLFSPDDLPKLREFLWKIVGFKGPGDPVHSQTIHLTPTLLQLLLDTGVRPFRIPPISRRGHIYSCGICPPSVLHILRVDLTDGTN